ncbi:MAG: glycosyl hydrolase family 39 [Acidobacteriaceae bacterium]|nr:glycosyl hydrolase family 39 [Acidobacteriaceae bacterium]MBV9778870.1 glycosyl hydrolase family 39 [Acidobacteriaceae bacterium]
MGHCYGTKQRGRLFRSLTGVKRLCILASLSVSFIASGSAKTDQASSQVETISVDANAPAHPFPHIWEQMFGSGRAILSLRESYRRDLKTVKEITGFKYVRFHAIFHDEVGVYDEDAQGKPIYNFSYVDQIYDGLLESGVKPFVELSFMPRKLAANLKPHAFWYKPLPSPPKDPAKWAALIEAFTKHLVDRYGNDEVEQWYFEVWNEPNIDFWNGIPQQATYFQLYDVTAKAVKSVDPKIRVGGPATAQAAWVDKFIAHCTQNQIPFDFVSTHVYGNDTSQDVFGNKVPIARRDMVARAAKKVYDQVKSSAAPDTPIIWSEYNASYMTQQEVTDSAFMGPWLANNIRECDGLANMMSYWTFSDVFEEQGVIKTPFYGGYGLVAEGGIPKATFRAFELLHHLGDTRLETNSENALVTKRGDGTFVIALWNYAEPREDVGPKTFRLEVKGSGATHCTMQFLDPDHGSALKGWQAAGGPPTPTQAQFAQIIKSSELDSPQEHAIGGPITIARQGLAVIELR